MTMSNLAYNFSNQPALFEVDCGVDLCENLAERKKRSADKERFYRIFGKEQCGFRR
ncbi:hypothetical protein [Helicobacter fennelliae]|uniref:hypothetical protein n=1 Tax=Helicobacter fennelliae TaxID=215 RepID=UPI0015F0CC72|nr:hypothetical protein [Helicobacter fennelliae]